LLAHPLTRDLELDSPETTHRRREIIRAKPFLRKIYAEWYRSIVSALPAGEGAVLELGSGGGFLSEFIPGLITSDVLRTPGISLALDAQELPVAAGSLRAIVMANVLHHLPQPSRFLAEATRCVRPGGAIVMIEPWASRWSRLIYTRLHHEPFAPNAPSWDFAPDGPLSGANGALPWIMFERDRDQFATQFPQGRIERVRPFMPLSYLLSGGVSRRALMPGWTYAFWLAIDEGLLRRWMNNWAMFAQSLLIRREIVRSH
jgi:SAM-dependent methyltransferase